MQAPSQFKSEPNFRKIVHKFPNSLQKYKSKLDHFGFDKPFIPASTKISWVDHDQIEAKQF